MEIYTLGHSTRSALALLELLQEFAVKTLLDIRRFPYSRHNPQFDQQALRALLFESAMSYIHEPRLGGRRSLVAENTSNDAWQNASFRAFADYMQTRQFEDALRETIELAARGSLALMCAEAVPWRCHRSLIADALTVRGITVHHIHEKGRAPQHVLTSFAEVDGNKVSYPLPL